MIFISSLRLYTGHGLIGTTHAADVETLVNRVIEQDVPTYLLDEIDLLVFPRHVDGERYVGEVVELVGEESFRRFDRQRDDGSCGVVRKGDATVYWNTVVSRRHDGGYEIAYAHPDLGDEERDVHTEVFERLAGLTDQPAEAIEEDFHRKHRYVRYFEREGVADGEELFAFLADLESNEAATVERIRQQTTSVPPRGRPPVPDDTDIAMVKNGSEDGETPAGRRETDVAEGQSPRGEPTGSDETESAEPVGDGADDN